ncbi:uncharacterized protein BKA55DRAFT_548422 [Fusarium redolens]|jgi:hypothetical protein|uniref:Uncharacterized protein n=1 Tax=Fusarium redolens TaxID=48865 RepID=A0A9P9KVV2_FUSRE|nr:uncharacterized protein BKA55DRAFT_548422 [Fusarium redolens]KAH7269389.1 hypothetical protein BKA55DRAFT_548422 [Fusarium redolens]
MNVCFFFQCLGPGPFPLSSSRAVSFLHHVLHTLLSPNISLRVNLLFPPPGPTLPVLNFFSAKFSSHFAYCEKSTSPFFVTVKRGRHVSFSSCSVLFSPCSCITSCPPRVVSTLLSCLLSCCTPSSFQLCSVLLGRRCWWDSLL